MPTHRQRRSVRRCAASDAPVRSSRRRGASVFEPNSQRGRLLYTLHHLLLLLLLSHTANASGPTKLTTGSPLPLLQLRARDLTGRPSARFSARTLNLHTKTHPLDRLRSTAIADTRPIARRAPVTCALAVIYHPLHALPQVRRPHFATSTTTNPFSMHTHYQSIACHQPPVPPPPQHDRTWLYSLQPPAPLPSSRYLRPSSPPALALLPAVSTLASDNNPLVFKQQPPAQCTRNRLLLLPPPPPVPRQLPSTTTTTTATTTTTTSSTTTASTTTTASPSTTTTTTTTASLTTSLTSSTAAVATHRSWSFPRASDSPSSSPPAGPKRSCSPKKCAFPLCRNSARSRGFCYSHGGGRRCGVHGCNNGAVSRDLCKRHGGGRRCRVDGCKSSAESGGLCYSHGGGRRCSLSWCSARAKKGGLCVVHWTTSGRTAAADAALTDTSSEGSDVVETLLALAKEPLEGKTGAAVSMAGAWSVQGSSAQSAYAITSLLN